MESFLHPTRSLAPSLRPLDTSAAFPHSIPPAAHFRATIRRAHCLTWVLLGRESFCTFVPRAALVDGDGHNEAHYADDWPVMQGPREEEWLAMGVSDSKGFLSHCIETWGLPVAFGAAVGSLIARGRLVFFASFSCLLLMVVHRVLQDHKGRALAILLAEAKNKVTITLLSLPVAIVPLRAAVQTTLASIFLNLATTVATVSSFVACKTPQRVSLSLERAWSRCGMPLSMSKSDCKSPESILTDIGLCIDNVEGMIQGEIADMGKLRENVALLKVKLSGLFSKSCVHELQNLDVGSSALHGGVRQPLSLTSSSFSVAKFQPGKSKRPKVDKTLTGTDSDAQVSKRDDSRQIVLDLRVVTAMEDGASSSPAATSDNILGHVSSSGPALGMEGRALAQGQQLHPGESNTKAPENGSQRSGVNRIGQPKYVDYWIEQDLNGAVDVSSKIVGQSGSGEQNIKDLDFKSSRKDGFDTQGGQAVLKDQDIGLLSSNADKRNFWVNEARRPASVGPEDDDDRSIVPYGRSNHSNGQEQTVRNAKSNEEQGMEGESLSSEKERQSKTESKGIVNGSAKQIPSPQQKVTEKHENGSEMNQSGALLSSSKELAFAREDPGMHALTGLTRRRNDEEFQKFMNEGEASLKDGKAGLNGKMAVGEAETMLRKAAEAFASAAAIDESSIEALGFLGNTLLVHGELKLNMSRDLRQIISTPDIMASYQTRRSRVVEPHELERLAALHQSFEAVCEECEELLIQAGRKYRMVLSIDNGEVRALYNWGLALCFRAELIAEEGGQNALEAADRVYLAAVDKFEAMMGISRRYAPGAMLNWGLTLRARSRLRPMGSLERLDLLQQAKQLLQDALRLQPDDSQIRGTFTMCSEELKELQERQGIRSRRNRSSLGIM